MIHWVIFFYMICILLILYCYKYNYEIKLLFFIASYGSNQLNHLYMQIKSFIIICESGYSIKIIIHHTEILNNSSFNNFYCFNKENFIEIVLIKVTSIVKHYLVKEHRKYIIDNIKEINNYDHIGFFENDIGFNLANLNYYLYTLNIMNKYNIKTAMPGFKRYEISKCSNGDIWRSNQDFINNITFYNIKCKLFVRIKIGFSAMWLLPLDKLKIYIKEKEFLQIPDNEHQGIEGLKPYYSYNYWEKHYIPLIPLERIDDCFVHHMSNKYINYRGAIQITELYNQMNICRSKTGLKYIGQMKNGIIKISRRQLSKNCVQLNTC